MRILILFFSLTLSPLANAVQEKVATTLSSEPVGFGNYLQMFLGLFIVVALIFGMAWFMRRMGNMRGMAAGNLKILGGLSVGQRERIVLIQAGNTQLLVGVAPGAIRTLHVLDELIPANDEIKLKKPSGFAEKLQAAIKKRIEK